MSQMAAAAGVLWKSLTSVLTSANQEMRLWFEIRVVALLADIAAASGARRAAIVGAGGGTVVDWLLESMGTAGRERDGTRDEAARALAYLVADEGVRGSVLGRPGAVSNLLKFIFSFQPKKGKNSQIDQSNALSAAQAGNQLESELDSADRFPLADLLSMEPFAALFKNMKKINMPKFDAADSAFATLKGVKALSELCSEDAACQNKLADFGVLCLLRRLLTRDDYENLAAIET